MAKLTIVEYREKHARRLKAAVDDMRKGVERVTESPTAKAAAAKVKMQAKLNEAINSGKWEDGLKRVSTEQWKGAMIEKGINRVASGIDGAADKVEAFAADLLPHIEAGQATIKKMPDVTLEDSISRMTAFCRHMSKLKRTH